MNFPGQAPSPYQNQAQNPSMSHNHYGSNANAPNQSHANASREMQPNMQSPAMSAAAMARRRQMAMLPPQFQNLSPQQLQELKNQPQFQNMLRQYMQRQQMMQQMGNGSQGHMGQAQNMGQGQRMGQMGQGAPGQMGMGMANQRNRNLMMDYPNGSGRNAMSPMNSGGMSPSMSPAMAESGNVSEQFRQLYSPNPAAFLAKNQTQSQNLLTLPQNVHLQNQQNVQNLQNMHNQQALGAHGRQLFQREMGPELGYNSAQNRFAQASRKGPSVGGADDIAVAAAAAAAAAAGVNNPAIREPVSAPAPKATSEFFSEQPQIPPQFAPSSASDVPLEPMASIHQWSKSAEDKGEPVSLELKMYEDLIKKDDTFLRKYEVLAARSRQLMEKMASDIKAYGAIKQLRMNAIGASAKNQLNNSIWGEGYQGYGNGISNTATRVILPAQNKLYLRIPEIAMTDMEMNQIVMENQKNKQLVPIRLDFDKEKDKFKLRDAFLWDLDEQVLPLESFVKTLIEDYKFIPENHFHDIYQAISEQIKDFRTRPQKTMGEIRIPIKIDLLINNTQFTDQFEWDILNDHETDPEEFATILCDEMSLPGEFATAIAFSIREQSQMYHKALFLVGYAFDGSPIREDEIRGQIGPPLRVIKPDSHEEDFVTALRNPSLLVDFSPSMNKLTHQEIEKIDKEMERESRRRRRHIHTEATFSYNENGNNNFTGVARGTASRRSALHSGRGAKTSLPNLTDIPKMFRTPMPSSILPGGVDLGVPDIYGYNEFIVNRTQVPNPDHKPPAPLGMVTSFKDTAGSFYVRIRLPRNR